MKERITWFIVGLLLGAIISTASIYFYTLSENNNTNTTTQNTMENRGTPPEAPNGNQGAMPGGNTTTANASA